MSIRLAYYIIGWAVYTSIVMSVYTESFQTFWVHEISSSSFDFTLLKSSRQLISSITIWFLSKFYSFQGAHWADSELRKYGLWSGVYIPSCLHHLAFKKIFYFLPFLNLMSLKSIQESSCWNGLESGFEISHFNFDSKEFFSFLNQYLSRSALAWNRCRPSSLKTYHSFPTSFMICKAGMSGFSSWIHFHVSRTKIMYADKHFFGAAAFILESICLDPPTWLNTFISLSNLDLS